MKLEQFITHSSKIGIIGLGYVGLPLAELLGRKFKVLGLDINSNRIEELKRAVDKTHELTREQLMKTSVEFSSDLSRISECRLIIVTVPTPVDKANIPNLNPVKLASQSVGKYLAPDSVVVYESTVYPGVTEEFCVPIIEKESGLVWMKGFHVGYSPERVNPGDKHHTIDKIIKIVSGDCEEICDFLAGIYGSVISDGIHKAPTIKTAEAAKVIENTQRDLNIALMNELSIIFNKMNINTSDVLAAAKTKWNFLPFTPGLVGGHCIGVDPYYLTHKAESMGYHPQVILSGRKINDRMGQYVAEQTVKRLVRSGKASAGGKILICGFTFKENIPDLRNTKVIDIYNELLEYGLTPIIYDPMINPDELRREYCLDIVEKPESYAPYEAVILAVKHQQIIDRFSLKYCCEIQQGSPVIIDIKGIINLADAKSLGVDYFSL